MFQVIPAIDLLNGEVVRLRQGDYSQVEHYNFSPSQIAKRFEEAGAKRIHLVDLDGAKSGTRVNENVIKEIRNTVKVSLQLGGGIRTLESAKWYFDLGIDNLILGSLIIHHPDQAKEIVTTFPNECFAGVDTKNGFVATQGWIESSSMSLSTCLLSLQGWPLAGIIVTDIAKDGMMSGPNIDLLTEAVHSSIHHPIIASGGVTTEADIETLKKLAPGKLTGCIVGKAILSGKIKL